MNSVKSRPEAVRFYATRIFVGSASFRCIVSRSRCACGVVRRSKKPEPSARVRRCRLSDPCDGCMARRRSTARKNVRTIVVESFLNRRVFPRPCNYTTIVLWTHVRSVALPGSFPISPNDFIARRFTLPFLVPPALLAARLSTRPTRRRTRFGTPIARRRGR